MRKDQFGVSQTTKFWYNAAGNRVKKQVINHLATDPEESSVTYYVRDANEAVMAIYQQTVFHASGMPGCVRKPNNPSGAPDWENDGVVENPWSCDNCRLGAVGLIRGEWNPWQEDYDQDGLGDACDPCPFIFGSVCGPQQPDLPAMPDQWTGVATTTKLAELPIYGSERLGLMRPNVLRDTVIVINPTPSIFTRRVDQKEYELKDHLGNVRVVVSDMKKRVGDLTATFTLRVKSVNAYYAFGMLEEGMSGSSEGYRYGFQGQEMDNEINGVGNLYTAEYWEYDSRLGRRWNIDPRTSPEGSSYRTFSNNPIIYIDPFGDKEYSSMEEYKKATGKEELGEGDWLTEDREKWTEKWIKANLYNLKNTRSSEYTDIEQRRDFYRWFYGYSVAQGFETRWALAASIVADGAAKIAHTDFGNIIGVTTSELQKALEVGNQLIFDNVLPKLSSLISISPLKGNAAVEWDAKTLSEEQWLVQPMYNLLSSDAFDLLHNLATKSGVAINLNLSITNNDVIDKSWTTDFQMKIGTVPAFPSKWSLKNPMSRWFYGMMVAQKFRSILLVPVYVMPKNINYLNGQLFLQGIQKYNTENPDEKYLE